MDFALLALNAPPEVVQTAIRLTLASAPSGTPISAASDYSLNFGNVDGLGIGPAPGLTTTAAAGGIIYSTGYEIASFFSDFSSTVSSVNVYLSNNFAHPAILQMEDSLASSGPFRPISSNVASQTRVGNAIANRSINNRYIGLFVSSTNGPLAFNGTDHATLTYTLTVP